jgi:hypothetical protein
MKIVLSIYRLITEYDEDCVASVAKTVAANEMYGGAALSEVAVKRWWGYGCGAGHKNNNGLYSILYLILRISLLKRNQYICMYCIVFCRWAIYIYIYVCV